MKFLFFIVLFAFGWFLGDVIDDTFKDVKAKAYAEGCLAHTGDVVACVRESKEYSKRK